VPRHRHRRCAVSTRSSAAAVPFDDIGAHSFGSGVGRRERKRKERGKRERERRRVSGGPRILHPGPERGRSQGGLDILHAPRSRTGYYNERAVVIAERQSPGLLSRIPTRNVWFALRCGKRAARTSRRLATWRKSSPCRVAIHAIKERERHNLLRAIPGYDNGGYFHAVRKIVALISGKSLLVTRKQLILVEFVKETRIIVGECLCQLELLLSQKWHVP